MKRLLHFVLLVLPLLAGAESDLRPCGSAPYGVSCRADSLHILWVAFEGEGVAQSALLVSPVTMEPTASAVEKIRRLRQEHNNTKRYRIIGTGMRSSGAEWNLALGQKSAETVKEALVDAGISASLIEAWSYGSVIPDLVLAKPSVDPTETGEALATVEPSQLKPLAPGRGGYAEQIGRRLQEVVTYHHRVPASAVVRLAVASSGRIASVRLMASSGHRVFDEAVLRGLNRMDSLPTDADGKIPEEVLTAGLEIHIHSSSIRPAVSPLTTNGSEVSTPERDTGGPRDPPVSEMQAALARQQALEQQLAAESKERQRQADEVRAALRRQQELEAQLAAAQLQAASRPIAQAASVRSAHALVIGNAAYPGSMRLLNPVNDATAISQKLRALGFTVTTVTDMSRRRLVQAMAEFRKSAANADLSLLFYSGHGVQIFGTNYILPTDVDQGDVAQATIQGVRLNEVLDNFMPGKTKLVFLDACRDNPLMRSGDRSVSVGLAPMAVAQGTLISYATKDGQVALDGVGARNSPFTTALLEHLGDPNDIAVVLRKVREKVMQATAGKQQPWEYGSLTGGELVLSAIRAAGR